MANLGKTKALFGFTSPRTIEKIIPEIELLIQYFDGRKWDGAVQRAYFDVLFKSGFYEAISDRKVRNWQRGTGSPERRKRLVSSI
jgi:hypothetical protein